MDEDLRIQDLVGILAGVKLKQVVLVLRTLPFVLDHMNESELADKLEELLIAGAHAGEYVAALHSRPERANYEAAGRARDAMLSDPEIQQAITHVRELAEDPYYGRNIDAPAVRRRRATEKRLDG